MWLFSNKKKTTLSQKVHPKLQSIKNAYLVNTNSGVKIFESKYDAQVEALRLELLSIEESRIQDVIIFGPSKSSIAFPSKSEKLEFDDLPEHVKNEIDAHRDGIREAHERDEAKRKLVASRIHDNWSVIVEEYRSRVEKLNSLKDTAIKEYISNRSMTSSRVREICDEKSHEISILRSRAQEQGQKLVKDASKDVDIGVELDDLLGLIPDIDSIALDASFV